jgi:hypothetical protein
MNTQTVCIERVALGKYAANVNEVRLSVCACDFSTHGDM